MEIPKEFLAKAHNLSELSLNFPHSGGFPSALTRLPADFLARVPSLTSLQLATYNLTALPDRFLAGSPHISRLSLDLKHILDLPNQFLPETSELLSLRLAVPCVT